MRYLPRAAVLAELRELTRRAGKPVTTTEIARPKLSTRDAPGRR